MPDEQSSNTPERQQDTGYDSSEDWTAKWSNVFRLATGRMTDEGSLQWKKDRDDRNEEADCAKCEKNRDYLLQYSRSHLGVIREGASQEANHHIQVPSFAS